MNLEGLISFETAKLAKEKGFKKLCDFSYDEDGILTGNCEQSYNYVAPTQSLLQKWLREKHDIHITITSISQESWQYHIQKPKDKLGDNYEEDFENYEEALEVGLQEALKLI